MFPYDDFKLCLFVRTPIKERTIVSSILCQLLMLCRKYSALAEVHQFEPIAVEMMGVYGESSGVANHKGNAFSILSLNQGWLGETSRGFFPPKCEGDWGKP